MRPGIAIIGCGWLGLALAERLVQQDWEVNGSTTRKEKLDILVAKGIRPFLVNVGESLAGRALSDFFDAEILMINIPPGRSQSDVEVRYPQQIHSLLTYLPGTSIQKILFISSTSVYPDNKGKVDEATPVDPISASGKAILQAERLVQQEGKPFCILRMAGLVGGTRRPGRWLAGKTNLPKGQAPVNLVHRQDCIHIIEKLLRADRWNQIYNVCADEHPVRATFYTQQAKQEGVQTPDFQPDNKTGYKVVCNEKLKKELPYQYLYPDPQQFKY